MRGPRPAGGIEASERRTTSRRASDIARTVTGGRPHLLIVAGVVVSFAAAYVAAFLIRFEFTLEQIYVDYIVATISLVVILKLLAHHVTGVFRILWPYLGLRDLIRILQATALASTAIGTASVLLLPHFGMLIPRSILILDGLMTFLGVAGFYALLRVAREVGNREGRGSGAARHIFVVGAGDAGERLVREMQRSPSTADRVVGFIDDDPSKRGQYLRGVRVLGSLDEAKALAERYRVSTAYIAVPSANGPTIRRIVKELLGAGLAVKILPPGGVAGPASVTHLREVMIEDLLRRPPVWLDDAAISRFVTGKVILVTGAAGSIGSEICRQVMGYRPEKLVVLDCAETPLHELTLELRARFASERLAPELGDITDETRVETVFREHRPHVVFHAAAFKHVPMLEAHPREAVRVNVGGTRNIAEAAHTWGAEAFVMISTDKAVNPSSVMGATKRVAELLVRSLSRSDSPRYVSVRFGNVLGSSGSVIPLFKRQVAEGGPVTVTHPDMKRYFMTIPEAVQLVLQAAVLGQGGEIFVLDMGEPVRIVDLAEDLIRLSGLVPDRDIRIEFSGIRPGERLFEELRLTSEVVASTAHPQVFCLRPQLQGEVDPRQLDALLESARDDAHAPRVLQQIRSIVTEFASVNHVGQTAASDSPLAH